MSWDNLTYNSGFDNEFASEALPGALPRGQNNPRKCPYNLYAEQLSGSAFTCPRGENYRTWCYRKIPSVHLSTPLIKDATAIKGIEDTNEIDPVQKRWQPFHIPEENTTFLQGLHSIAGAGSAQTRSGINIYVYACNKSMENEAFYNSDGEFLIVPQKGSLRITTELGKLYVKPEEICVIPQGVQYKIEVEGPSRGYIAETMGRRFKLPSLGPIGANGLANPRDFLYPVAGYENYEKSLFNKQYKIVNKYLGKVFSFYREHTPFDVVAWHGNHAPYKYDLNKFMVINATSFDHADPSIFTVLTAQSGQAGVALCDFVIFPPRWAVQEHTFRPPYYHRNCIEIFIKIGLVDLNVSY